jgi:hypothetical protein
MLSMLVGVLFKMFGLFLNTPAWFFVGQSTLEISAFFLQILEDNTSLWQVAT